MRAIGIILAGGNNRRMQELTTKRAVAAMPIASSYRAIDFALSNMSKFPYSKGGGTDTVQCAFVKRALELIEMVGFWTKTGRFVCIYSDHYSE